MTDILVHWSVRERLGAEPEGGRWPIVYTDTAYQQLLDGFVHIHEIAQSAKQTQVAQAVESIFKRRAGRIPDWVPDHVNRRLKGSE